MTVLTETTLTALKAEAEKVLQSPEKRYVMFLMIEGATPEPEIIINPKENIAAKIEYFGKAYNEDLTLKNNPKIKITGVSFHTDEELRQLW